MSTTVIGVDGCRGGWVAAIWQASHIEIRLFQSVAAIFDLEAAVTAIDMPMGLPERHGRKAEQQARQALVGRKSSVFAVPSRAAIAAPDYKLACAANLRHSDPPRRLSQQSFHLFPKIREIDSLLTPDLQARVFEVHPELSFSVMNGGRALSYPKKTPEGEAERRALLLHQGVPQIPDAAFAQRRKDVARDDVIDACAAAWSARRILDGRALHFPESEERDACGLLMRIHA